MTNNQLLIVLASIRDSLEATNGRLAAACMESVILSARKDDLYLDVPENDDEVDEQIVTDVNACFDKATILGEVIGTL